MSCDDKYIFVFEKPKGWESLFYPSEKCNTLKEAKALQKAKGLETPIAEIWHDASCNLVWGFINQNEDSIPSDLLGE